MYSYISLKVNCPNCNKSLLDRKTLVDDIPGIKLSISEDGTEGIIHLSSFYGSYNYDTDLTIVPEKVYKFSCPHCNTPFLEDMKCNECSAGLVHMNIKDGGVVRFCSRAGCKKRSVEFEDLSSVHHYFQETYEGNINHATHTEEEAKAQKEIIKSGTFLRMYCKHCKEGLIEKGSVIFRIINENDETGFLMLSPYLNVFTNKSTIFIPDGAVVKDITCPHCKATLIDPEKNCQECGSPAVETDVAALRKLIEFNFCSKKGCHWHSLDEQDLHFVVLEDSEYW
ncbi:MAG: hypothetical protein HZR80_04000 [Candidatus Heimdallarchaeota archaeon]